MCWSNFSASEGPAKIVVTRHRTNTSRLLAEFAEGVADTFTYAVPYLHSITPNYGPLSGGTLVKLVGSALNVSNTALTSVRVTGIPCKIQ